MVGIEFNPVSQSLSTTSIHSDTRSRSQGSQTDEVVGLELTPLPPPANHLADTGSHPRQTEIDSAVHGPEFDLVLQPTPPKKIRQLKTRVTFWVLMVPFTAFVSQYVYQILLLDHPNVGRLFLSPADTNLLITILSQVLGQLIQALFKDIFDVLRWQLASRERGVPMPTFFQLSGATTLLGVCSLIFTKGNHHIWGLQRLLLPPLGIFLGSILKYHANFEYRIAPTNTTIPVFAGLAPFDRGVLDIIPTSVMCIYYLAWISSLLGVSKYATGLSVGNCTANCTAVFLPGGLELTRKLGQNLNDTIFEGGIFDDVDAVLLNNAPGVGLQFSSPSASFAFDLDNDCQLYETFNDAIQICITPKDSSNIVGWSICPTDVYRSQMCTANTSWTTSQPKQQTQMSVFRQHTTTTYDRQNFSIISTELISPQESVPIDPNDYRAIWAKLFDSGSNVSSDDSVMVNSFMYMMGWYLRLNSDEFINDEESPLNFLQNFLAIPIQFSTTALQFANATLQVYYPGGGNFSIPTDLQTTASGAQVTPRFIGRLGPVCAFIVTCSVLVLYAGGILGWIFFQGPLLTDPSAFPEFDIVAKSGAGARHGITLSSLAQAEGLTNAGVCAIRRAMRRRTGRVIRIHHPEANTHHLVFILQEDTASTPEAGLEML